MTPRFQRKLEFGIGMGIGMQFGGGAASGDPSLVWTMDASVADSLASACTVAPDVLSRADTNAASVGSNGLLRFAAANQVLRTYDPVSLAILGFSIAEARTSVMLQNRDLTQAAWTKGATATVAKDQQGADGAANACSSITFGAVQATNTVLQAVTLASSSRAPSALVKRITGSGTIEMTTDGGTTWVNVTSQIDGAQTGPNGFRIVTIPAQTVTNPSMGFRGATNGDKIAVDYIMNTTGAFTEQDPWFPVAGAAASRNLTQVTVSTSLITGFSATEGTIYGESYGVPSGATYNLMAAGVDNNNQVYIQKRSTPQDFCEVVNGGVTQSSIARNAAWASTTLKKCAGSYKANLFDYASGGTSGTPDTSGTIPTLTKLAIGANSANGGHHSAPIKVLRYYNVRKTATELNALTT